MKNKYLYIILLSLLSIIYTACEDRLDIPKQGNLGAEEDFYYTDSDAEQAVAALYLKWRSSYFDWFFTKNLLSDDVWCGGGSRGDNNSMEQLNEYTFGTDHSMIQNVYTGFYEIIYHANLIIDKVNPDSEIKRRTIAEAHFFRAWAHFELVTLFGTAPIVDHLLTPSEYRPGNGNAEATWAFIESDLAAAIDYNALPTKLHVNDAVTGIRVTQEVAYAYWGKSQLFQKKYSQAAISLDKVIESDKYALYQGDYDQLLHAVADNCCESLLEGQMRNDSEQAWNQYNMLHIMQGWRYAHLTYNGGQTNLFATGGYGFCNPRKDLYEAFVAAEGPDGYRLRSTIRTYNQLVEAGVSLPAGNYLYGNEGYFMWKNRMLKADCVQDFPAFQVLQFVNLRVMRYAEVLFMAAEAHLMSGSEIKALEYINQIRSRARLKELTNLSLDDIKKEKRLELCLECVRFQDLIRWADAESVLSSQGKEIPSLSNKGVEILNSNTTYGFKEKHKLLPIPAKELLLNTNMKQNSNW